MIITNWVDAEVQAKERVLQLREEIRLLSDEVSTLKSEVLNWIQDKQTLSVQVSWYEKTRWQLEESMDILRTSMNNLVFESVDNASKSLAIRYSLDKDIDALKSSLIELQNSISSTEELKSKWTVQLNQISNELFTANAELQNKIHEKESTLVLIQELSARYDLLEKKETNIRNIYTEMKNARKALEDKELALVEKERNIKRLLWLEQ